jgi:hypothetical protein
MRQKVRIRDLRIYTLDSKIIIVSEGNELLHQKNGTGEL